MSYSTSLSISPLTTQALPASVTLPIVEGRITRIELLFPLGCAGLVGIWIEYQDRQILPHNNLNYYVADGETIDINVDIYINDPPYALKIRGFNQDDTFNHTVYVRVTEEFARLSDDNTTIVDRLKGFFNS